MPFFAIANTWNVVAIDMVVGTGHSLWPVMIVILKGSECGVWGKKNDFSPYIHEAYACRCLQKGEQWTVRKFLASTVRL